MVGQVVGGQVWRLQDDSSAVGGQKRWGGTHCHPENRGTPLSSTSTGGAGAGHRDTSHFYVPAPLLVASILAPGLATTALPAPTAFSTAYQQLGTVRTDVVSQAKWRLQGLESEEVLLSLVPQELKLRLNDIQKAEEAGSPGNVVSVLSPWPCAL